MGSPTLVFFQIVLVILIPLHFHINFQIRFLISKKFLLQLHWIYRSIWGDWHLNNIESSNPRTQCMSLDLFLSFKFHFQLFIASIKKYNWFLYTDLVSRDFVNSLLVADFLYISWDCLHWQLCHWWTERILFLLFNLYAFYFTFLPYCTAHNFQYNTEKER